jgi:hypothetical protein
MGKALSGLRLLAIAGAAIALSLACAIPTAHAETIKHIRIEGAQRIEPSTIQSYIDLQAGDAFEQDKLDRALKNLFATGLFADVSLYQEGQDLVIVVVENPIINQIAFEGNKKVKEEDLNNEIQLRPRNVLTRTKVQADVEGSLSRRGLFLRRCPGQDHQARPEPREPHLRNQRGAAHVYFAHRLRRQQALRRKKAAEAHPQPRGSLVALLVV